MREKLLQHSIIAAVADLSLLSPEAVPSLLHRDPALIDYVQLPMHLWVPDFFLPHLVPNMPCPEPGCVGVTARRRWHSGGPRLIHGIHSAEYLHCWEYSCSAHPSKTFSGWDSGSLNKLSAAARSLFRFVLTKEEGVTLELHRKIVEARVTGSSLHALQRELCRNRYTRMFETITAYYQHCEQHAADRNMVQRATTILHHFSGQGATPSYAPMPPILHNPDAYFDHEPPSIHYMSELYVQHGQRQAPFWTRHAQQLTSDRVCFDATFKVAKRVHSSSARMLWSMMDLNTGCILTQQLLTHERHDDVLPMFSGYAARCRELRAPLPTRVCSDRGLLDAGLIHNSNAFPDAHINIDPWHFHQLFAKTLDKRSLVWRDVTTQFNRAMYVDVVGADGKPDYTHAEPDDIIAKVDALVAHYSNAGSGTPAITKETKKWWSDHRRAVSDRRICSHPSSNPAATPRMSSSPLENYHAQLNKLVRIARCSEDTMHALLLQLMFKWNVDRRRVAGLEFDWRTYELSLVHVAQQACVRVIGKTAAVLLFNGFVLPPALLTEEHFGLLHPHVTLTERLAAADAPLSLSPSLMHSIVRNFVNRQPLISASKLPLLLEATPQLDMSNGPQQQPISLPSFGSTSAVSSSSSSPSLCSFTTPAESVSSVSGKPQVTTRRLSWSELGLLADLIRLDTQMADAVAGCDWNQAAGRWNSFVKQWTADSYLNLEARTALHVVHSDILRAGVMEIERRGDVQVETEMIALQAQHHYIPRAPVPPAALPFSEYENQVLLGMVVTHKKKSKKAISWQRLLLSWESQYYREYKQGQQNRLQPRALTVLKAHYWSSGMQQLQQQRQQSQQPQPLQEHDDVQQPLLPNSQSSPLSASSFPPAESLQPSSTTTAQSQASVSVTLSSAVSCMRNFFSGALQPPSSSSSSMSTSSPTASSPSAPSSSPCPTDRVPTSASATHKWHWSEPATKLFNQLCGQHNFKWSYEEFNSAWPKHLHGSVDKTRFYNKDRHEKRKREGGAAATQTKKQRNGQ